jgi:Zn-dependent protease
MILNYFNQPTILVISAVVMVFALIFHNVFQAWVASRLGDSSPRFAGFLNFEPQQHLEPMGVLFLFLLGFGWTRPIPANSRNYRRNQEALVWYAGPLAYFIVAFISVLIGAIFLSLEQPDLFRAFAAAGQFAVVHAVINLFPLYPLDGARAALVWGPPEFRRLIQQIAQYGFIGFIVFFLLMSYLGITQAIMSFFLTTIYRLVSLIPGL